MKGVPIQDEGRPHTRFGIIPHGPIVYNQKNRVQLICDTGQIKDNEIKLFYGDRKETWIKTSSSLGPTDFIRYDGYTYILKEVE